jgi:hypothetical protein
MEVMPKNEYERPVQTGNLSDCSVPEDADAATVWAVQREFELRGERLARARAARPGVSLVA